MSLVFPFSDLALARRFERTEGTANQQFIDGRARVFPDHGACWIDVDGTYAMFDRVDSPLTQTFGLGLFSTPTAEQLDRIERFFRERGAPINHETSPLADAALPPLLGARGYKPIEYSSVLYQPLSAAAAPPARPEAAVVVERLDEGADEERYTETAKAGWSGELAGLDDFLRDMGRVQSVVVGFHRFLALIDGQPVATGALFIHEGVALFAGASTIPSARRRGAQLALLEARLQLARSRGCDLAMMVAAPGSGSQRNAERNGFRMAYTRVKWKGQ